MPAKIMIVDDDLSIRFTVAEIFSQIGEEVLQADSAKACLSLLKEGFQGVILLDIMMPEHDGWDCIRMMRQQNLQHQNYIVMLTALDTPNNKMEGLQESVCDYLTKPFDSQELISRVQSYAEMLDHG